MSALGNVFGVKFRVALVTLGFAGGLAVVGAGYYAGAGKIAEASANASALSALSAAAGDIDAATQALRGASVQVRYTRSAEALKAFADGSKDLAAKLDQLAASPHDEALSTPIGALKDEIDAIGKQFAAVQQVQQTAGDSTSSGLVGQANAAGQALLDAATYAYADLDTLEGEQMRRAIVSMLRVQMLYEASFDEHLKGNFEVADDDFDAAVKASNLSQEAKDKLAATAGDYLDAYKAATSAELDYVHAADALTKAFDPFGPALKTLLDAVTAESAAASDQLAAAQGEMQTSICAGLLAASIFGLIAAFLALRGGGGKPLGRLRDAMERLAAGDLSVATPALGRNPVYAAIERAFGAIKQEQIDDDRSAREATARREAREADAIVQRDIEAERAALAREQEEIVAALAKACECLSAGNLTYRIAENFPPAYQKVKDDLNAAMGNMQNAILVIAHTARAIGVNSEAVSSTSDDLSRRTEQQAASLEETAATLTEITQTVKSAAEAALHAREVVAAADGDAKKGARVVREAVSAMDGIAKSAQQITHIIGVIDEIAFQTNLLALNAGVEAARAGEAGRGFAVVASEVRALAQRSAEAAKEIKGLISASTTQVGHGVELVAETGAALERIMAQVADVNTVIANIAAGAREQATGLDEVNIALGRMDQVTQQNAAMVQQSTETSRSLSHETNELSRLVGQFEIDGEGAHAQDDRDFDDAEGTNEAADEPVRRALQKTAPHVFPATSRGPAARLTRVGR
jgi:methyl-accepting chemotaxis protein